MKKRDWVRANIRHRREMKGWSVIELAGQVGVPVLEIQAMESGVRPVRMDVLDRIADALGVEFGLFFLPPPAQ